MTKVCKLLLLSVLVILQACSDNDDNDDALFEAAPTICTGTEMKPERLFLQQVSASSAIVKWRGDAEKLCFGTEMGKLDNEVTATVTETEHSEALLTGLDADTTYYYSVGAASSGTDQQKLHTAPATGSVPGDGNIRVWIIGDSGEADDNAAAVRDGYLTYNASSGGEDADLFLMLGDNAYTEGTDAQHQAAVFDMYPDILNKTPVWPTIGNHEMGSLGISSSADINSYTLLDEESEADPGSNPPYLNIFSLPMNAEAGGIASGTEQYYSFDYGNLHVVSLDSQVAARDDTNRATMRQWLIDDLAANTSDWTIVIFHHPPYTKGSHDSDNDLGGIDQPIFAMREEFNPIFEQNGVDLIYSGHSHAYERSYYLQGHTGLSDTFDPAVHTELNDGGQAASGQDGEAYSQIAKSGMDDKAVYTVAGSSSKATFGSVDHPANFFGMLEIGSVVVDLNASRLDARFIDVNGDVLDFVTITR
ncbi:MAG: purple acid phosphatase family protein [Pseudomonadales bacterium]